MYCALPLTGKDSQVQSSTVFRRPIEFEWSGSARTRPLLQRGAVGTHVLVIVGGSQWLRPDRSLFLLLMGIPILDIDGISTRNAITV